MYFCYQKAQPATIYVKNVGDDTIVFTNTVECRDESTSCVSGPWRRWTEAPLKAGEEVAPGTDSKKFGTANSVWVVADAYRIYMKYKSRPDIIVYIYLSPSKYGFTVGLSRYNASSPDDLYDAAELIEVDTATSKVTVSIPSASYWLCAVRPLSVPQDDGVSLAAVGVGLVNVSLSTIITACFIIPGWGAAAIPLTVIEGLFQFITSAVAQTQRQKVIDMTAMLETNKEAIKAIKLEDLRGYIEEAVGRFSEQFLGLDTTLTAIATKIQAMDTEIRLDEALQQSIVRCLDSLGSIVLESSELQKSLSNCLHTTTGPNQLHPPSKTSLGLIFSAICMTMNAFAYGWMLCTFIKADAGGWKPSSEHTRSIMNECQAENLLEWMFRKQDAIRGLRIRETAKQSRLGLLQISWDYNLEHSRHSFFLEDAGLDRAAWGAGKLAGATEVLKIVPLTRLERRFPNASGWHCYVADGSTEQLTQAKSLHAVYSTYLEQQVEQDYTDIISKPLADLDLSGVTYLPFLNEPLAPTADHQTSGVTIQYGEASETPIPPPKFCFIRYGYATGRPSSETSKILWQESFTRIEIKTAVAGEKTSFSLPIGVSMTVPMDVWNQKAEQYAKQANKLASEKDPTHKPIWPPFNSSMRMVWRCVATTDNSAALSKDTMKQEMVTSLDNSEPESFVDIWPPGLLEA